MTGPICSQLSLKEDGAYPYAGIVRVSRWARNSMWED